MFSRASEKDCDDGRGYQQEQDTGTSGYGTVTQVLFTAFCGACAFSTEKAVLGHDTLKM